MEIKLVKSFDEYEHEEHDVYIDGKYYTGIGPMTEYPEDATIERGLLSGYNLIAVAKLAYEAGKTGKPLKITITEE